MEMLTQVLLHTPRWVGVLFVILLAVGIRQSMPSQASLRRVALLPLLFAVLSFMGVASAFPTQPLALAAWIVAAVAFAGLVTTRPAPQGTRFDPASGRFSLPGSLVPLALMLAIFSTRYVLGAALRVQPALAHDATTALVLGALCGAWSGVFVGRALRLWRLAMRAAQTTSALPA
jgi:hypothetical protein